MHKDKTLKFILGLILTGLAVVVLIYKESRHRIYSRQFKPNPEQRKQDSDTVDLGEQFFKRRKYISVGKQD